jgi:hypothetical protein
MAILEVTDDQLHLIQRALDLYSRVGIGQMWAILDHPTFEKVLADKLRPKRPLEVGDATPRGEITEIGKNYIKTKGHWDGKLEEKTWTDVENVKHSTNYSLYHEYRKQAEALMIQGRNIALQEQMHTNASYGIYNPDVDESSRVAFDIIQVIRHEFWKANPGSGMYTVASSVDTSTADAHRIKCKLD